MVQPDLSAVLPLDLSEQLLHKLHLTLSLAVQDVCQQVLPNCQHFLPPTTQQLGIMIDQARELGDQFGTNISRQIEGFYQAVSAGASDAAQATRILTNANKLAIGGITDVTTGVDILTTATNAYAASGLSAAEASDALFVGMRAGKTTISQLASGLGNVIPIAASLNVRFDELVAGTAALTTQGLSTASAITSLRAILSAVAKPTAEASKLAKQLGIEFNASALATQGLAGFLQEIIEKTGGSTDSLALLFGQVEALNGVLSFAGGGGEKFNSILADMAEKAGATDQAFTQVAENLDFRLTRVLAELGNRATDFGNVLLTVLVPSLEFMAANIDNVGKAAIVATPALALMFGPAIIGGAKALALAIAVNMVGAMRALTAAIAANPIGFLITAITTAITYAVLFHDEVLAAFQGAFEGIQKIWGRLPYVIGDIFIQVNNTVIRGLNRLLQVGINSIDRYIDAINALAGTDIANIGQIDIIPEFNNPFSGEVSAAADVFTSSVSSAIARVKELNNEQPILNQNLEMGAQKLRQQTTAISGPGGLNDSYQKQQDKIQGIITGLQQEYDQLLANGEVQSRMVGLRDQLTGATEAQRQTVEGLITSIERETQAQKLQADAANFTGGLIKGAISDLKSALDDGKLSFSELGDIALNILNKISDKLIDMAINNLVGNALGGGSAGIGGGRGAGAGGFLSSIFSIFGFAKGGVVQAFAQGGVVDSPVAFPMRSGVGVAGEAGSEAIMPLARMSNGDLGVQAAVNARGGSTAQSMKETRVIITLENGDGEEIETTTAKEGETTNIRTTVDNIVSGLVNQRGTRTNSALQNAFALRTPTNGR